MSSTTYYKVLRPKGVACHGGSGSWPLPSGKRPGKWLEISGEIRLCHRGLHLCRKQDLVHWLGPTIYIVEADESKLVVDTSKVVVHRARLVQRLDTWNDTTQRLFAADCAKDAVRRCRKAGIEIDPRVIECIRIAYRFARGEATEVERSAARSVAWSAAESVAWSAAESAAWSAAWFAAESAAWSAAWFAAESAARSAARSWQTRRLFEYLDGKRS